MESINVNYPFIIKELSIDKLFDGRYVLIIRDDTDKFYAGYFKSIDGGGTTVNISLIMFNNGSRNEINLKYNMYDGCLLEKAMEEAGVNLNQLIGE